jgi:hypothetical protein
MSELDRIPASTKDALELVSRLLSFISVVGIYSQQSCEMAAYYLERELLRDEEAPVRELAPHIANFLKSQKDME